MNPPSFEENLKEQAGPFKEKELKEKYGLPALKKSKH